MDNLWKPVSLSPPTSLEYFLLRHVLPGYFESLENIERCLLTSLRRRALASGSLYPPQVLLCFCQCISQEPRGCSPFWHERRLVCLWVSLLMSGGVTLKETRLAPCHTSICTQCPEWTVGRPLCPSQLLQHHITRCPCCLCPHQLSCSAGHFQILLTLYEAFSRF